MEKNRNEMLKQQIRALAEEDESFIRAFVAAEDAASLQAVLQEHGIDAESEELDELFAEGVRGFVDGELTEDELEVAAGGGFVRGTLRFIGSCAVGFGYGAFCAVCPAAYAAAPYVATGLGIWTAAGYAKKGW